MEDTHFLLRGKGSWIIMPFFKAFFGTFLNNLPFLNMMNGNMKEGSTHIEIMLWRTSSYTICIFKKH